MQFHDFFTKVYCVSLLSKRPERRERLDRHLVEAGWPFAMPEYYSAIHGETVGHPEWWRVGNGAWGCYRSHLNILERCLNEGIESVLILEDDAVLHHDFPKRVEQFLTKVPDDWGMLYLGGQHLHENITPPRSINDEVMIPFNVNRTHAYAVRGEEYLKRLYHHLLAPVFPTWNMCEEIGMDAKQFEKFRNNARRSIRFWNDESHHIDHRYGVFHGRGDAQGIYCPTHWLVAQAEGWSDIKHEIMEERFWDDDAYSGTSASKQVFVLGLHNSGSTVIAGILHQLGVWFGDSFGNGPWGISYEKPTLAGICEKAIQFPFVGHAPGFDWAIERIKTTLRKHRFRQADWVGVKYPLLCAIVPELPIQEFFDKRTKISHCNRSLEHSIQGLKRRMGHAFPFPIIEKHQCYLHHEKLRFLDGLAKESPGTEILEVDYDDLVGDPEPHVRKIASFLGLRLSNSVMKTIQNTIDPAQQHFGKRTP